ncbi:RNA polymerase sigma factor [Gordonia sp. NPDC003376]
MRPIPGDLTEAELLARAQTGDAAAFTELVGAHRDRMWAICLRTTGNRTDAEDALQEALVAAWRALPRFRGDARLSTWLFRIASNAALAQIRKRSDADDIDDVDFSADVDIAGQIVVADRIADALAQVPDAYRATFVLRVYGDLSYADIAEAQGIGLQTVRSRISRARTILADLLADLR